MSPPRALSPSRSLTPRPASAASAPPTACPSPSPPPPPPPPPPLSSRPPPPPAGAPFTLTATGTNFAANSVVQLNGSPRPTSFVTPTQLTATILASDIASAGAPALTVFTPAPGGGTSGAQTLSVTGPALAVSATSVPPGASLTATLTNPPGNASDWLGLALVGSPATSYVQYVYVTSLPGTTSKTWSLTMPTTLGQYEVRLYPNNGYLVAATSPAVTVANIHPTPTISSLSPASIAAGSAAFPLTVTGTGFVPGATATVGGLPRRPLRLQQRAPRHHRPPARSHPDQYRADHRRQRRRPLYPHRHRHQLRRQLRRPTQWQPAPHLLRHPHPAHRHHPRQRHRQRRRPRPHRLHPRPRRWHLRRPDPQRDRPGPRRECHQCAAGCIPDRDTHQSARQCLGLARAGARRLPRHQLCPVRLRHLTARHHVENLVAHDADHPRPVRGPALPQQRLPRRSHQPRRHRRQYPPHPDHLEPQPGQHRRRQRRLPPHRHRHRLRPRRHRHRRRPAPHPDLRLRHPAYPRPPGHRCRHPGHCPHPGH